VAVFPGVAICLLSVVIGAQVSMKTLALKQQHVGVPTVSVQIPRSGNGVGSVSLSWPVGSCVTVNVTLATTSCLESVALNGSADGLAQGLGLTKNVGSVQGLIVFIFNTLVC
jgi:hypothetical protein